MQMHECDTVCAPFVRTDYSQADAVIAWTVTGTHPRTALSEIDVVQSPHVSPKSHRLLKPTKSCCRWP